jgi:hypothetical protein
MLELSSFFAEATAQFSEIVAMLSSDASQSWEHGDLERQLHQDGRELLRKLLQGHLELRYAQEGYERDVVGSDRVQRPHWRKETQRKLETLFGEVEIRRVGYSSQQPEVSALYPADGKLNLPPDKYSDELRRHVALEASKVSFAETSRMIEMTSGGSIGKRQCEDCPFANSCERKVFSQRKNTGLRLYKFSRTHLLF